LSGALAVVFHILAQGDTAGVAPSWISVITQGGIVGVLVWAQRDMHKSNKEFLDETRRAEIARTDALLGKMEPLLKSLDDVVSGLRDLVKDIRGVRYQRPVTRHKEPGESN